MTYRDIIARVGTYIVARAAIIGLWTGILLACLILAACDSVPYRYGGTAGLSSDPHIREMQLNRAAIERGNRQAFTNAWTAPYGRHGHGGAFGGSF